MALTLLPAPRVSDSRSLSLLERFPGVKRQLRRRGVALHRNDGESDESIDNRVGTALMALYRDTGSEAVFEALHSTTESAVLQWIRGLLGRGVRQLDPVELVQDTFVNVFRYPKGFRDTHAGSYRVWVRTIAGNIVRRARTRQQRPFVQSLPDGFHEPVDPKATPESSAQHGEQERGLRTAWMIFLMHYGEAWKDLRPRDKLALHLVEVEGRSYVDAGAMLDVGRSNMKMIIFRSRKRIARRMAESLRGAATETRRAG